MIPLRPSNLARATAHARVALFGLSILGCAAGCHEPATLRAPDRYRHGVVFVLPGIEGRSPFSRNIAVGLDDGGVSAAIETYDWTTGIPGNYVWNLADYERNRRSARLLAQRITEYRREYPSRPVTVIGHSGGGGIAVLALEELPDGESVDAAILLAPALTRDYDLTRALRHVRSGMYNFFSRFDLGLLGAGTTIFGAIDRGHGISGGALGFEPPADLDAEGRALYDARLRQVEYDVEFARQGHLGGHFTWTSPEFIAKHVAPLIARSPTGAARGTSAGSTGR